jgi:predicted nucleic acid-binding protein
MPSASGPVESEQEGRWCAGEGGTICIAASLAAKWVVPEDYSDQALALFIATAEAGEQIIAPPLLPIEVTNIIRRRMRAATNPLSLTQATEVLARFLAIPVRLEAPADLYQRALTLAATYQLPAAYDAHYLAISQIHSCTLWTDDQRLLHVLGGRFPTIAWVGDYSVLASSSRAARSLAQHISGDVYMRRGKREPAEQSWTDEQPRPVCRKPVESPQAFYKRITQREDVRRLLAKLTRR